MAAAGQYIEGKRPWGVDTKFDVAIPGATQNEIELEDAQALVKAGVKIVLEGANMPSTSDAIEHFHKNDVVFGAAKVGLLCHAQSHGWTSSTLYDVSAGMEGNLSALPECLALLIAPERT